MTTEITNSQEMAVLGVLSSNTPMTRAEITQALSGNLGAPISEHVVYRILQKLIGYNQAMASPFRRGKEIQYLRAEPESAMPKITPYGAKYNERGVRDSYPVWAYVLATPDHFDYHFTSEAGADLGQLGTILTDLFAVAISAANGVEFDRKAFQQSRKNLLTLKERAQWLADTASMLIHHPSLNGSAQDFVDAWANNPQVPISLEELREVQVTVRDKKLRGANAESAEREISQETPQ